MTRKITGTSRVSEPPATPLEFILGWSNKQSQWLQDALRRTVISPELTKRDMNELVRLCKKEFGAEETSLQALPLQPNQLPNSKRSDQDVELLSISEVMGVNQLAPKQQLDFGPTGVTVIYGDNGAGKTGYTRILKQACRARMREEIIPNVFDDDTPTVATARIAYQVGGSEEEPVSWVDSDEPDPILSAVSVFDHEYGAVHIQKPTGVELRPFGLDIPDRLANACKFISDRLKEEEDECQKSRDTDLDVPPELKDTKVAKVLGTLQADTELAELRLLAKLSEKDERRYRSLEKILKEDPNREIKRQRDYVQALKDLSTTIRSLSKRCSRDNLMALRKKSVIARMKRIEANSLASDTFDMMPFEGLGEEVWLKFWEAARSFSEQSAYPGAAFPVTDAVDGRDPLCILCMQDLDDDARDRFEEFANFARSNAETEADEANDEFRKAMAKIIEVDFPSKDVERGCGRLAAENADLAQWISEYAAILQRRLRITKKAIEARKKLVLPALEPSPLVDLDTTIEEAELRLGDLKDAVDPDKRARLMQQRDELAARLWLRDRMAKVKKERERLQLMEALQTGRESADTTKITKMGNKVADQFVTRRVQETFEEEINALIGDSVLVEKQRMGGRSGVPRFQVRFRDAPGEDRMEKILSEGEKTSISIAAFLAELAFASHTSAIVFDDPVSSLDHKWQRRLARRLVAKAREQQIIIFTHDLVFAQSVEFYSEKQGVECKILSLSTKRAGAGVTLEGFPWEGTKVNGRKEILKSILARAKRLHRDKEARKYEKVVKKFYRLLRATWERALEEVALGNVITRFRDQIDHRNLTKASVLTKEDCETYKRNHRLCSDIIDAHDTAPGRGRQELLPDELQEDFSTLENWIDDLKERQKQFGEN